MTMIDGLSRDNLSVFFADINSVGSSGNGNTNGTAGNITSLEADVQRYFEQGLAPSTQKTYKSGINTPQCVSLPVNQTMLCLYHF